MVGDTKIAFIIPRLSTTILLSLSVNYSLLYQYIKIVFPHLKMFIKQIGSAVDKGYLSVKV